MAEAPHSPGLTFRAAAALCAGIGGLLFETAILRGLGLVLGNTAAAAAIGIGAFLLGLGLGGALASRRAADPSCASAARLYGIAAIGPSPRAPHGLRVGCRPFFLRP